MIHFPNNAKHGIKEMWQREVGHFRKELLEKEIYSTHDAILNKMRTGTTRSKTQNVKEGDLINVGKYGSKIVARVTKVYNKTLKELFDSGEMTIEEWSLREGWNTDYIEKNPQILKKYPIDFTIDLDDDIKLYFKSCFESNDFDEWWENNKNNVFNLIYKL